MTGNYYPPRGQRVMVTRQQGDTCIARRDWKRHAIFRNPSLLHWLDDDDKFVNVRMNPVVSWRPLAGETKNGDE